MALRFSHKHEWHYTSLENHSTEKLSDYLSNNKNNGQIHKLEENAMTKYLSKVVSIVYCYGQLQKSHITSIHTMNVHE